MAKRVRTRLTIGEARRFGLTVGAAFGVFGGIAWWRGHGTMASVLGGLAALLILGGLVTPAALRPVHTAWMNLALAISRVTTPIILGILYYLVVLPTGLIMRAAGRNPMRHAADGGSYFRPRDSGEAARGDLERQF